MFEIGIHQAIGQPALAKIQIQLPGDRLLQIVGAPEWPIRIGTACRGERCVRLSLVILASYFNARFCQPMLRHQSARLAPPQPGQELCATGSR